MATITPPPGSTAPCIICQAPATQEIELNRRRDDKTILNPACSRHIDILISIAQADDDNLDSGLDYIGTFNVSEED